MKTTKQNLDAFKANIEHWQRELGLDDWHIHVVHEKLENAFASTSPDTSARVACIRLATSWPETPTKELLNQVALHEVMHIVCAPLANEAQARFADEYTLNASEHSIVVRMTNYILRSENA